MAPQQKNDIEKCGVAEAHPVDSSKDKKIGSTKGLIDEKSHGWFIDSFKPQVIGVDGEVELHKDLSSRHIQMIAIGGSIGSGLFIGSGGALATGGPAFLIAGFGIVGILIYFTMQALAELCVVYPVKGSFCAFSTRFVSPAWGFAMGWNYAMQWLVVLPLEIVAAAITLQYWNLTITPLVFITIFWVVTVVINFFGVRGYAEAEFVYGAIKVAAVILFIILGIVINLGGAPDKKYYGSETWRNPGAIHNSFKGFCSMFVNASFAFAGTELVGLAAAETADIRKVLPDATKQVVWRIILFYFVSLLIVGFLVPYNNPDLLGGGVNTSPFVIAITQAGIKGLPDFMNFIILISTLSVGNSAVYGSSRVLLALVDYGQAPKIFGYVDRAGRPLVAVILSLLLGAIAYVGDDPIALELTFNWLLALSGLSSLFTWGSICYCHIRFRHAWHLSGRTVEEIPYAAAGGVVGSWVGLVLIFTSLAATCYTALFPIGGALGSDDGGPPDAEIFFLTYLAVPVVIVFFIAYLIYGYRANGLKMISLQDMDLATGMNNRFPSLEELRVERAETASKPFW
eukprot:CAMPEP_0119048104 /NCGR_PEP_ID=MMETSP1177-20130426/56924_1 /TAXON_ID=2985 /ORGANISM="Ochromonas sp, Strain CCMP1899" /LENGTH=568 /DNA_ID=CAMNT_0007023533 /DNA_START=152 /DNA_END=1855 /DNA_ORIENTATION=-